MGIVNSEYISMQWLDETNVGLSWMGVWKGKFNCGNCLAIIDSTICPICNYKLDTSEKEFVDSKGGIHKIPLTLQGSITYMTFTYINLMQREWERKHSANHVFPSGRG